MSETMRHLTLVFASLCLLATTVHADIADGLIAYWPLDEGSGTITADVSGSGSEGAVHGGPNWVDGKFGSALEFDGSDDYVDCGNPSILDFGTSDFTISAWVNSTDVGGETVVAKGGDNSGGIRWRFRVYGTTPQIVLDDNATKRDPPGSIDVTDGDWHHMLALRRGTSVRVYVDGVEDPVTTGHSESTLPADYDLSGTSQHNAYIGCLTLHDTGEIAKFFAGVIDDVAIWNRALTPEEISFLWNNGEGNPPALVNRAVASQPSPEDGAMDVWRDTVLSWTPGIYSPNTNGHIVYFGETFDGVDTASDGAMQDANTFDPGRLAFDQTYYWRVDEVNGVPDHTVHKGPIWQFTTEPAAIPITSGITATASSSFDSSVPENTINGSGLLNDLHGTAADDMWISADLPATIEYAFDRVYKLHELWIWNANQNTEALVGFGAKDVVIETSVDGETWVAMEGVGPLAQGTGEEGYAHNTEIDLGGAIAQFVRVTVNSVHGIALQTSLSEVRFYYIPTFARKLEPADGAVLDDVDVALVWRNGREAAEHEVYLGIAENAALVSAAEPAALEAIVPAEGAYDSYFASALNLSQTYAWKVVEVNAAESPSAWASPVTRFTTPEYLVIDDMEFYADEEFKEIWAFWVDGFDDPQSNGAVVGAGPDYLPESGIVHGGNQSLPVHFDNSTAPISEATRTFDEPQDWSWSGITTLVLYVYEGDENAGGELYVKINSDKVPLVNAGTYPAGFNPGWVQYNVDLTGMNVSSVGSLTIGVEGAGANGVIYVDDIRLYAEAPELTTMTLVGPVIEAESGVLTAPLDIFSDLPDASGGQYIMVPETTGNSNDEPASRDDGWAVYTIDIPADGDYLIAFRGAVLDSDSFWVNIPGMVVNDDTLDDSGWVQANALFGSQELSWDLVPESNGPDTDPAVFTLSAGQHELQISRREDGTVLDAIAIFAID